MSVKENTAVTLTSARQMSLMFERRWVEGMGDARRAKAVMTLAHLLMQATGLVVEELGDEQSGTEPGAGLAAQDRCPCAALGSNLGQDHPGEEAPAVSATRSRVRRSMSLTRTAGPYPVRSREPASRQTAPATRKRHDAGVERALPPPIGVVSKAVRCGDDGVDTTAEAAPTFEPGQNTVRGTVSPASNCRVSD